MLEEPGSEIPGAETEFSSYFVAVILPPTLHKLSFRYTSKKPSLGPRHLPIPRAFIHACVPYSRGVCSASQALS